MGAQHTHTHKHTPQILHTFILQTITSHTTLWILCTTYTTHVTYVPHFTLLKAIKYTVHKKDRICGRIMIGQCSYNTLYMRTVSYLASPIPFATHLVVLTMRAYYTSCRLTPKKYKILTAVAAGYFSYCYFCADQQSTHGVAMATLRGTFHRDGKISPAC
jgi:hypothetical protein